MPKTKSGKLLYTEWGAEYLMQNYKPKQKLEVEIYKEMLEYSTYKYLYELGVGLTLEGTKYRVDAAILELLLLISLKSQRVSGSVDLKIRTDIQDLQKICEDHGWRKALLVIDDPNKVMKRGQAYLDKGSLAYREMKRTCPLVEVITKYEFKKRLYNKLSESEFISIFGEG